MLIRSFDMVGNLDVLMLWNKTALSLRGDVLLGTDLPVLDLEGVPTSILGNLLLPLLYIIF